MPTTISTIENGRAKFAFDCAEKASTKPFKGEYKPYVKKMPMLIKTNGLGSALAFIFSKSGSNAAYSALGNDLREWLKKSPLELSAISNCNNLKELVAAVTQLNSTEYRLVTAELMAFLNWLRRFADGLIQGEENGNG
jgi:CRISPR-associated protein Cmr5